MFEDIEIEDSDVRRDCRQISEISALSATDAGRTDNLNRPCPFLEKFVMLVIKGPGEVSRIGIQWCGGVCKDIMKIESLAKETWRIGHGDKAVLPDER